MSTPPAATVDRAATAPVLAGAARAIHTALKEGLSTAPGLRDAWLPTHLLRLERKLRRLAGDDRWLQLVALRLTLFRAQWPTPQPADPRYRADLRHLVKIDLPRIRDQLVTPNPRHKPPPAGRARRR